MSEQDNIEDITPKHEPVGLLREALKIATEEKSAGCLVVLVDADNCDLWFDMCGATRKDLLWALAKMQKDILDPDR